MISVSAKEQFNPKELKLDLAPFSIGNPIAIKKPLTTVIPGNPNTSFVRKTPEIITQIFKAKSGDTIVKILSRAGVSKLDIQKSMAALKKIFNPKKFQNKSDPRILKLGSDFQICDSAWNGDYKRIRS